MIADLDRDLDGLIYVLLPAHNRRAVTEKFVDSLLSQTDKRYQLVLVDDGSTDGTESVVLERIPDATVIRGTGNWWWAGSLDRAYHWLRRVSPGNGDIILIANDDTLLEPGFLAAGRSALMAAPHALLLARLHRPDGKLEEVGVHVDWRAMSFEAVLNADLVNCFSTRGLFLRARDFVSLRGFHPHLLPHYGSDYEFTMRAARLGFALRTDPSVRLTYDPTTTGIRTASTGSLRHVIGQTLSRRSTENPFYMSTFLVLSCPRRYLPRNLARVWWRFLRLLGSAARPQQVPTDRS